MQSDYLPKFWNLSNYQNEEVPKYSFPMPNPTVLSSTTETLIDSTENILKENLKEFENATEEAVTNFGSLLDSITESTQTTLLENLTETPISILNTTTEKTLSILANATDPKHHVTIERHHIYNNEKHNEILYTILGVVIVILCVMLVMIILTYLSYRKYNRLMLKSYYLVETRGDNVQMYRSSESTFIKHDV